MAVVDDTGKFGFLKMLKLVPYVTSVSLGMILDHVSIVSCGSNVYGIICQWQ